MSDRVCGSCVPGVLCTGLVYSEWRKLDRSPCENSFSERSTLPTPSTEQPLACSVSVYSGPFWTLYVNGVIECVCVRSALSTRSPCLSVFTKLHSIQNTMDLSFLLTQSPVDAVWLLQMVPPWVLA